MLSFEVYRSWGKRWRLLGCYKAVSSLQAAKKAHALRFRPGHKHLRLYGARPEDTNLPLFTYKFWSA